MNLPTITADPAAARSAIREYRTAVLASLDREAETWDVKRRAALAERREADAAILKGYRAILRGTPVLELRAAIHAGGADAQGRPKLAVGRADEPRIRMSRQANGAVHFRPSSSVDGRTSDSRLFRLPVDTLPRMTDRFGVEASAIVPSIPPRLRPRGALEGYAILWEAEWTNVAPRDPALLRPLGGGLYAVVAVWDLTDLERAVLGSRRG